MKKIFRTDELYLKIMSDLKEIQEHYYRDITTQRVVIAQYLIQSIIDLDVIWDKTDNCKSTTGDLQLWNDVLLKFKRMNGISPIILQEDETIYDKVKIPWKSKDKLFKEIENEIIRIFDNELK